MNPFMIEASSLESAYTAMDALAVPDCADAFAAPHSKCRILTLIALENAARAEAVAALNAAPTQDARRLLSLTGSIEAQQAMRLCTLLPSDESATGLCVLRALAMLEVTSSLAQMLPESTVRQSLQFLLPEQLDVLYRLSNLLMLLEGRAAEKLLGGTAEVMPGRPLIACHRHPFDEVRLPLGKDANPLMRLTPLIVGALAAEQYQGYLQAAAAQSGVARDVYLQLALHAQQQEVHLQSLLPPEDPLTRHLQHEYAECYVYHSFALDEQHPGLQAYFAAQLRHEATHLQKAAQFVENQTLLGEFPPPLCLVPSKGFLRDMLQHIGVTALREKYVPVGILPRGADFYRCQKRLCPRAEAVASHQAVACLIGQSGSDYRFEIAPHPIRALRDRGQDNTEVGR